MRSDSRQYGVTFCGQHTWSDLGLVVLDKKITFPKRDKAQIALPYSSRIIDLSSLYGLQPYAERTIELTFLIIDQETLSKDVLYNRWTKVINLFESPKGKSPLIDDIMPEYYYLAEMVNPPTWDEYRYHGKFTLKFDAYPFRIHVKPEGDDIWDTFNFESDVAQITKYEVNGSKDIELINIGTNEVQPTIVANANFVLITSTKTINISAGTTNPYLVPYPFVLPVGESKIYIQGTGTIEFQWHKELI